MDSIEYKKFFFGFQPDRSPHSKITSSTSKNTVSGCCHPSEYDPITLVYMTEEKEVKIKEVPGMIARRCACAWSHIRFVCDSNVTSCFYPPTFSLSFCFSVLTSCLVGELEHLLKCQLNSRFTPNVESFGVRSSEHLYVSTVTIPSGVLTL